MDTINQINRYFKTELYSNLPKKVNVISEKEKKQHGNEKRRESFKDLFDKSKQNRG